MIEVDINGDYPQPIVFVTGPDSYSVACSNDSLEIESIVLDTSEIHTLVISWEISASNGGTVSDELMKDINEADDLYLDILSSRFTDSGTYTFTQTTIN